MTQKKIVYFDMDGVLVDFKSGIARISEEDKAMYAGRLEDVPGIFSLMDPIPGAIDAVKKIAETYDVFVLSTAPWLGDTAWSDKLRWIQDHFGEDEDSVFYKRLILSHHKNLCRGDYLIDDRTKHGVEEFCGEHIHFGSEQFPDWDAVVKYLCGSIAKDGK